MELEQVKENVIQAGRELVKAGLIARTWGNVSARIGEGRFAITPSGMAYETLTPDKIVVVNIADGSYGGEIEPSSEKGIHIAVYRQQRGINFIIHTHQTYASVISALHRDITGIDSSAAAVIGSDLVPCASYGLPGSKKLRKGVIAALSRSRGKAFLMANHGALCLGETYDEAFRVAAELEQICSDLIMRRYLQLGGRQNKDWDELRACYLAGLAPELFRGAEPAGGPLFSSEREGDHFRLYLDDAASGKVPMESARGWSGVSLEAKSGRKDIPPEAEIHRLIYRRFKGIGAITHAASPDILAVSKTGQTIYPLLDDFAQIVGISVRVVAGTPLPAAAREIAQKLRGRYAIIIRGNGALCCGPSRSDAAAAAQVLEKGCLALIGTSFFGGARPINPVESRLMRLIYLGKYARKAAG